MSNVTDWIDGSLKPVRDGVYERNYRSKEFECVCFACSLMVPGACLTTRRNRPLCIGFRLGISFFPGAA